MVTITIYIHKGLEIPYLQIIGKCINIKTIIRRGSIKVCKLRNKLVWIHPQQHFHVITFPRGIYNKNNFRYIGYNLDGPIANLIKGREYLVTSNKTINTTRITPITHVNSRGFLKPPVR